MSNNSAKTLGTVKNLALIASPALCFMLLIYLITLDWFQDPFIRNDDYLAFFPFPDLFYSKTLEEGRWGNYAWTNWRPFLTPVFGFALHLLIWSAAASVTVSTVISPTEETTRFLIYSCALAATPQIAGLALWFNTILAAHLVLFISVIALRKVDENARRTVIFFATAVCFLTYPGSAFIFLMFAMSMGCAGSSLSGLIKALIAFVGGYASGIVMAFSLNAIAHGHFGIALADWREQAQLMDFSSALRNLKALSPAFVEHSSNDALNWAAAAMTISLPLLGAAYIRPSRPIWVNAMIAGASLSVLILAAQVVVTGAQLPPRATGFAWAFVVLFVALATGHGAIGRKAGLLAGVALLAAGLVGWRLSYPPALSEFQTETRLMAVEIERISPEAEIILIRGNAANRSELRAMNEPITLEFRLQALAGAEARVCDSRVLAAITPPEQFQRPAWRAWGDRYEHSVRLCNEYWGKLDAIEPVYPAPGSVAVIAPGIVAVNLGD